MSLPKTYIPSDYEEDIYALWEKSRAFTPTGKGKGSYSIVVPPPNANGNLHIGHALTIALEDIAVRYHRMTGKDALLLPGADHAGFETQVVYEKELAKAGKSRFDFTREEMYRQIWEFVAQNRQNFENQMRRLGAGVDWTRYIFTLDDKIVQQAYKTFKKMWDEELVYRGTRLVNFCTFHGTAFADIEVEYKETMGNIWHIRYPLTDGSGEVIVATTRPETMLGDTAVAVHPNDERYKKLVGKTVKLPLTHREIPILADEMVDKEFGTGAVKVTPAHDPNDYEVGMRHDLPFVTVINSEGKLAHDVPEPYRGLTVEEGRKKVVEDLKKQGLLVNIFDHVHNVGHCYKCGTVIEPLLREQWFIDMKSLAEPAIKVLKDKKITFYPDTKRVQLIRYLEDLRDWNISRQIAWGIPIPAFQNAADPDDWIFDTRVGEEAIDVGGKVYRRDPDVFDTWFSSSSWPYATLDFPDGEDFKHFYPLSLMETGGEILYPWVSRMIMLGLYNTGKVPFEAVYIHGYVMAEDGAKMSKSIGNVIDPIEVIDAYGSDALRMGIVSGRAPAVNRGYDHRRVEEARNFANKLWNIARFIEDRLGDDFHYTDPHPKTAADHWILTKLQHLSGVVSSDLENYRFSEAYEKIYHGVWDEFADWYIEASKAEINPSVLAFGLATILKIVHPFAPFVTETIWQTLNWQPDSVLATAAWPKVKEGNQDKTSNFEAIKSLVSEVRYYATALELKEVNLYHSGVKFLVENQSLIKQLAKVNAISEVRDGEGLQLLSSGEPVWLDVDHETIKRYSDKLDERIAGLELQIKQLTLRLASDDYLKKAPSHVVEQSKNQLKDLKKQIEVLQSEQKRFS